MNLSHINQTQYMHLYTLVRNESVFVLFSLNVMVFLNNPAMLQCIQLLCVVPVVHLYPTIYHQYYIFGYLASVNFPHGSY